MSSRCGRDVEGRGDKEAASNLVYIRGNTVSEIESPGPDKKLASQCLTTLSGLYSPETPSQWRSGDASVEWATDDRRGGMMGQTGTGGEITSRGEEDCQRRGGITRSHRAIPRPTFLSPAAGQPCGYLRSSRMAITRSHRAISKLTFLSQAAGQPCGYTAMSDGALNGRVLGGGFAYISARRSFSMRPLHRHDRNPDERCVSKIWLFQIW